MNTIFSLLVDDALTMMSDTRKHLRQVEKKPSCTLTNVVSTCVNKASSHLELLQSLIEEWFVYSPTVLCSGHDGAASKGWSFSLTKVD